MVSGSDGAEDRRERPSAMPVGLVKWTAYLNPSGVRYRRKRVGVPRVRQYGPPFARHAGTGLRGLTAHAARPASPGT